MANSLSASPTGPATRCVYPEGQGTKPPVLIWTDIAGLRPALRDMGRRLAGQGYVVLVPNPFYRSAHAPVIGATFDFGDAEQRSRLFSYRAAMTDDGIDRDSTAYLAFLDAQPQTDKNRKAGVQGYCMGGSLSFRTAAAVPARIAGVGSFHGGNGLVTKEANSPHLLIPKTKAEDGVCGGQGPGDSRGLSCRSWVVCAGWSSLQPGRGGACLDSAGCFVQI